MLVTCPNHNSDSEPQGQSALLNELATTLHATFDCPFDLWYQSGGEWSPLGGSPCQAARPALAALSPNDIHVLEQPGDNRYRLAIPFAIKGFPRLWAVGDVASTDRALLLRSAKLLETGWQWRQQLDERNEQVKTFIGQITDDFEELTFLRRLACHLALAEVAEDPWQVAKTILPLLRQLVKAESLVLIATAYCADQQCICPGDVVLRTGTADVDDATCRALVSQFRDQAEKQTVVRNHLRQSAAHHRFPGVESFILDPVAKADFRIGWLLAINRSITLFDPPGAAHVTDSEREFGTVEASLLSASSTMLATHGRNVQLFGEKEALLVSLVRALVGALDAKDPYTCGHSERVALIASRLGRELKLSEAECQRLYLSGLLHDIGKIGVSDAVLRKTSALTADEIAQLRKHPDDAWSILNDLEQLRDVLPGVLHHHESYDGKGYPDALHGEEIPRDARILAVADAYDAMTSDRPYRHGLPKERVDEILRCGAGIQWDPAVVDAFFRAKTDIVEICRSYKPHKRDPRPRQPNRHDNED
jgi:HD-GYP domain-containing protein (c-di-GMP phosphodiesterase class II)